MNVTPDDKDSDKASTHSLAWRGRARWCTLVLPLAIVVLAFVLRVVQLSTVPYGFFCDEATQGLDARALTQTLRDTHGRFMPFYLEGLGHWRGGFHTYCQIPFVALLGMTEFSVRLGSAVVGTLT